MKINNHFSPQIFWNNQFQNYDCPFYDELLKFQGSKVTFYSRSKNTEKEKKILIYINDDFEFSALKKSESKLEIYYYQSQNNAKNTDLNFPDTSALEFPKSILLKNSDFSDWIICNPRPSISDCLDPVFNVLLSNGASLDDLNEFYSDLIFERSLSFQHGIRIYKK